MKTTGNTKYLEVKNARRAVFIKKAVSAVIQVVWIAIVSLMIGILAEIIALTPYAVRLSRLTITVFSFVLILLLSYLIDSTNYGDEKFKQRICHKHNVKSEDL